MTVLDAPVTGVTPSHHGVNRPTTSPGVDRAFVTFLFAISAIVVHLIDAAIQQVPTYLVLWVAFCALGTIAVVLAFVYSGELTRALLSVAIGLVAVTEGILVAVPNTIKGAGADTMGLVSATAAVGLVVLGVVLIVRHIRRWRR